MKSLFAFVFPGCCLFLCGCENNRHTATDCPDDRPHRCDDGSCQACCDDEQCADRDRCTEDHCIDYACVHTPTAEIVGCQTESRVCVADGWCWENPYPQGLGLTTIHRNADGGVWAAGFYGTILQWNGLAWRRIPNDRSIDVYGLWSRSDEETYAVGQSGMILRWDGVSLLPEDSGTNESLSDVWGNEDGTVWVVGSHGTLLVRDATTASWSAVSLDTGENLSGIWGAGEALWIVGQNGLALYRAELHGAWQDVSVAGFAEPLVGIWGVDPAKVWAAGGGGGILRWESDEGVWTQMQVDTPVPLLGIGGASAENVWAMGPFLSLMHWTPSSTWRVVETDLSPDDLGFFADVTEIGDGGLMMVGDAGVVLKNDGASENWAEWSPTCTWEYLHDVHVCGREDVWVAGKDSGFGVDPTVLHRDGDGWSELDHAFEFEPEAIWGVVAGGGDGTTCSEVWVVVYDEVYRTSGTSNDWVLEYTAQVPLNGISGTRTGETIWVAGFGGAIIRRDGSSGEWVVEESGVDDVLADVWVAPGGDVWVAGGHVVLYRDAASGTWTTEMNRDDLDLQAVWGADVEHLWAVGMRQADPPQGNVGVVLMRDAATGTWSEEGHAADILLDVGGYDPTHIWAVGRDDGEGVVVRRTENGAWSEPLQYFQGQMGGIGGREADGLWMVGDKGAILRWHSDGDG